MGGIHTSLTEAGVVYHCTLRYLTMVDPVTVPVCLLTTISAIFSTWGAGEQNATVLCVAPAPEVLWKLESFL